MPLFSFDCFCYKIESYNMCFRCLSSFPQSYVVHFIPWLYLSMLYEYTAICLCVVLVMAILILSSLELLRWDCYDYSCTCVLVHICIHFCWVNGLELLGHRVYITELAKVIVPYCLPTSSAWEFQKLHIPHFYSCPPLVCLPHSVTMVFLNQITDSTA